jgi:hypothetical protein
MAAPLSGRHPHDLSLRGSPNSSDDGSFASWTCEPTPAAHVSARAEHHVSVDSHVATVDE